MSKVNEHPLRRVLSAVSTNLLFEDEEDGGEDDERYQSILRKHKSLPPRQKSVHFADGFGKPLVSVYSDDEYNIHVALQHTKRELQKTKKVPLVCFEQPVSKPDFKDKLDRQKICLENAVASETSVWGTVKVKNLAFHKRITVRYTFDKWRSSLDVEGQYVPYSNDGDSDRFSFALTIPEYFQAVGGRIELAFRYETDGVEFWDNNDGHNYLIECRDQPKASKLCYFNSVRLNANGVRWGVPFPRTPKRHVLHSCQTSNINWNTLIKQWSIETGRSTFAKYIRAIVQSCGTNVRPPVKQTK